MENRLEFQKDKKRKRTILFLDMLRGLAVVNMIAYHLLYDLVYIFNVDVPWFSIAKCYIWEQCICFGFILISGISFQCSRKPWKNGIKIFAFALILTIVTMIVIPSQVIYFGILHFLGIAILITWIVEPIFKKIPTVIGLVVSLVIFILVKNLPNGWIGIPNVMSIEIPDIFYSSQILYPLGFPHQDFFSSDYFSLIPWIFLFFTGYFGGKWWISFSVYLEERKQPISRNKIYRVLDASMGFVGRRSLLIYMLHQPLVYGILLLIYN